MGIFNFFKKDKRQKEPPKTNPTGVPQDFSYLNSPKELQTETADSTVPARAGRDSFQFESVLQIAQQASESLKIISETRNPETFFSRCKFFKERVSQLEQLERQYECSIPDCEAKTLKVRFDENFLDYLNHCFREYEMEAYLNLKTDTAIQKRVDKFWEIAEKYTPNAQELRNEVEPFYDRFRDAAYNEVTEKADREARETSDKYHNEWVELLNQFNPYEVNAPINDEIVLEPVELSFLKYMNKKAVKDTPVAQYWRIEYNINYKDLMTKLMGHGYLRMSDPYETLQKLKVDEIKKILDEKGLDKKGTKQILIDRIKENVSPENLAFLQKEGPAFYVLTEKGIAVTSEIKDSATKDLAMEDVCIKEILNQNFDGAYRKVCEWEMNKLIPRGIGIDWSHEFNVGLSEEKETSYQNFFRGSVPALPATLKEHESVFKACVILGSMLGVNADKMYILFIRLVDIDVERSLITELLQSSLFSV